MTIEAKVIADSVNPTGNRLTSFIITYPRFILAEINTHRALSRNSASSRAIPVEKMIKAVEENPAMPVYWGKNQKGMQADVEIESDSKYHAAEAWIDAMKSAVEHAKALHAIGLHKQIVNRVLEPFMHMTTLISGTEWGNFFNLRLHKDAQPEFNELAYQMLVAYNASTPVKKEIGQGHLPFADKYISEGLTRGQLLKISTARAARVSYLNFEGDIDHEKDYKLHDQLIESGHMSPADHPAVATDDLTIGNFRGWMQYRKFILGENRSAFDSVNLLQNRRMRCTTE